MTINAALTYLYFLTSKACVCTNIAPVQPASGKTKTLLQVTTANELTGGKKFPLRSQHESICTLTDSTKVKTSQVKKFSCILKILKNLGEI